MKARIMKQIFVTITYTYFGAIAIRAFFPVSVIEEKLPHVPLPTLEDFITVMESKHAD